MKKKQAVVRESGLLIRIDYKLDKNDIIICKVVVNGVRKIIKKALNFNPAKIQNFYFWRNGQKRVSLVKERKISCHFNDDTWIHLVYDFNTNSFTLENYKLNIF